MIHINDTLLSDTYKDAFGIRPRHYKEWWTEEELRVEYTHLGRIISDNMAAEETAQAIALESFNKLVEKTMAHGAGDRMTAIRWLLQAEGIELNPASSIGYLYQEVEHAFWKYGLSFEKVDELTSEILGAL